MSNVENLNTTFPLAAQLAEIGFPVTVEVVQDRARFQTVYSATTPANPAWVKCTISDFEASPSDFVQKTVVDQVLRRAALDWKVNTALDVVEALKCQVAELRRIATERHETIARLTRERDHVQGILDRVLAVANEEELSC